MTPNMKCLVIGDAHVDELQDLKRFDALGNYIAIHQPDIIVLMGDFLSLNCLSEWDRNKRKTMELKRYSSEIEAGNIALDMLEYGIYKVNKARKKLKTKSYTPRKIYIEGNHENRLPRYLDYDPVFLGTVSIYQDLNLEDRGWEWVAYKASIEINGVSFTHIPISGNGKAISNPNVAQKALKLYHNSVVFAHTHTLDTAGEHRHNAPHLNQALCAGCFFEHVDEYAVGSRTDYWRGVVMLRMYAHNRFDISTVSMGRLLDEYGIRSPS